VPGLSAGIFALTNSNTSFAVLNATFLRSFDFANVAFSGSAFSPTSGGFFGLPSPLSPWQLAHALV
jgi:hypothetical protein